MTVAYEKFLPELSPFVRDCPQQVQINALRNAAIEFCKDSQYWVYEVPAFDGVTGVQDYTLTLPAETILSTVFEGWYDTRPLQPMSEEQLRKLFIVDWRTLTGAPRYVTSLMPNVVRLAPMPQETLAGACSLIVALQPSRASTGVSDDIFERFAEVVALGARARLYTTQNEPYSDMAAGMTCRSMFASAIARVRRDRHRGLVRSTLRVRPPRWV